MVEIVATTVSVIIEAVILVIVFISIIITLFNYVLIN